MKEKEYIVYEARNPKVIHLATKIKFVAMMMAVQLAKDTGHKCNVKLVGEETHCYDAFPPLDFPDGA